MDDWAVFFKVVLGFAHLAPQKRVVVLLREAYFIFNVAELLIVVVAPVFVQQQVNEVRPIDAGQQRIVPGPRCDLPSAVLEKSQLSEGIPSLIA